MNIDKYKTFLACVEARTFYEAADLLFTTPSTVSKHIAALEKELGCVLFDRTPKGLILTEEGEKRVPSIRQIVTSYERLIGASEGITVNKLVVPTVPLFKRFRLENMMNDFAEMYPDVTTEIQEMTYLYRHLKAHEIPFAFMYLATDIDPEKFDIISFATGRTGILVPSEHPFAARSSISVGELEGKRLISQGNMAVKDTFSEYFCAAGITPRIDYVIEREDIVVLQAEKTGSIALFTSDVFNLYKSPKLVFVPFSEGYESTGQLVRLRGEPLPRNAKIFWDFAERWLTDNQKTR